MTFNKISIKDIVSELKIDRNKMDTFSYFCGGNLYYNVVFSGNKYQFYINATPKEVGNAIFNSEIRAVSLLRYMRMCVDSGEFIKLHR